MGAIFFYTIHQTERTGKVGRGVVHTWRTIASWWSIPGVGFADRTPFFIVNVIPFLCRRRSLSTSPPSSLPGLIMGRRPSSTRPQATASVSTKSGEPSMPCRVVSPTWGSGKAMSSFCCLPTPFCSPSFVSR